MLVFWLSYFSQNPIRDKEQGRTLQSGKRDGDTWVEGSVRLAELEGKWIIDPEPHLFSPQPCQRQRFRMHFTAPICLQWPKCFSCQPHTVIFRPNEVHLSVTETPQESRQPSESPEAAQALTARQYVKAGCKGHLWFCAQGVWCLHLPTELDAVAGT